MRLTKKAQMQAQIFIYITVLIIGAGILMFGYKAVSGFRASADDATYLKFETTFKNDLKTLSYQSIRNKQYSLPASIKQVCFKSATATLAEAQEAISYEENRNGGIYKYPFILNEFLAETKSNVFIYPRGEKNFIAPVNIDLGQRTIGPASVPITFKCFDVKSGVFKIRLEGQGSSVGISE